jgi:F420-0:gamma-glutamyl ligase
MGHPLLSFHFLLISSIHHRTENLGVFGMALAGVSGLDSILDYMGRRDIFLDIEIKQ